MSYLTYLKIHHFKSIEDLELKDLSHINIIVGANNSGKTSLINLIKNIFVDDKLNYNMSDIPAKNMREWVYPIFQKFFRDRKTEENVEKDLLNVVIPKEETDSTHLMKMTTVKIHVSYNPDMGNRYISNQPLLQRWVVSKDAVSKARCIVGCPNNIKINHAFDSVIRKYED